MKRRPEQLERLFRIEAACGRFEEACQQGGRPDVLAYVNEADLADRAALLEELLLLEWSYRPDRGRPPDRAAAQTRFPLHSDTVESAWQRWQRYTTPEAITAPPLPSTAPPEGESAAGPMPLPALPGYVHVGLLGAGGMGVVWRAHDPRLKRDVAIKFVHGHALSPQRLSWFRKEAEALGRLKHPAIVQVYTWEEHEGIPYLVMEYVPGGSLEEHLQQRLLPVAEAVRLVATLAQAVAFAHAAGVVHRDLKPANVLLDDPVPGERGVVNGRVVKISDFGLARLARTEESASEGEPAEGAMAEAPLGVGASTLRRTRPGTLMGTPGYMSPEQAAGDADAVGPATDVWALGVILYRCLSGKLPFLGATVQELSDKMREGAYTPLRQVRREVPAELEAVCRRCLNPDPRGRPAALGLAGELERIALRMHKWRWLLASSRSAAPAPPAPRTARRRPLARLGMVLMLLVAGSLYFASRPGLQPGDGNLASDSPEGPRAVLPPGKAAAPQQKDGVPVIDRAPIPDTAIDGVRVRDVRLRYYETVRGHLVERGLIGRQTRRVNAGDAVRVEVELSEPAFVYLLSFDVVGEERLLWPPDEKKPPPRTEKLVAPAGEPLQLQGVGEGDYFQAFVVVASREPLPGYARWAAARKTRGVWDRRLAPLDRMYRSDGKRLYRVDGEALVPVEGEEELKVVPPLEALCQLVQPAASSVAAVAFPVRARRDRLAMLQEEEQSSASQGRLKFALVGPHGGKDREPRGKPYGPLSAPSAPPVRLVPGTRSFTTAQSPTGQQKRELEGQETVYRAALALRLREVGENHEDIPCLLKGLADVVSEQGKWKEATQLYSRALQTARATFGSDHLEVAPLMSHLSRLHVRMGRLREALHLQHQTLAIYEARLGKDDLIVAASLKNLGDLHMAMQEYAKAEEAYRRSLQVREARLGKNHPDTATACEAIATALNAQGKYAEAHLKYEQALRIRSSALGRQHALTVQTITDLQTNKRRQTVKAPLLPAPEESRAIEATQPLRDKP